MKSLLFSIVLSVPVVAGLQHSTAAASHESIREVTLDERRVYQLPIGNENVTTVSFPGPISALDGAALTSDGKTPGKFQIAYKPGNYFFSVRSLVKEATTNLNVVWNRKTYVLELTDSATPVLSVVFKPMPETSPASKATLVTPARLIGLLDKAKAYPFLKEHHPDSVESVQYSKPNTVTPYDEFNVLISEAFRFDEQDTLIFRLVLENKTDKEIRYDSEAFALRVGERVYYQSISDASGVIPPKAQSPAYFAVTGTPNGGRNDLSLKNTFTVLVSQINETGEAGK